MVVAMARNGTDFGIQVSGTGDEWFTGPAQLADGLYLGDYGPDDANPDIGDSAITETAGIGGFAMATAPAIVRFVGGSVPDALATTRRMHEITLGENPRWSVPVLEFQGVPTGIDVTRVCRTGILPQINTGMAGKRGRRRPGRRRAGHSPAEIFPAALAELATARARGRPTMRAGALTLDICRRPEPEGLQRSAGADGPARSPPPRGSAAGRAVVDVAAYGLVDLLGSQTARSYATGPRRRGRSAG